MPVLRASCILTAAKQQKGNVSLLTQRNKENIRKAAHRMEEVFKDIYGSNRKPPTPTNVSEFNAEEYQIWFRIVEVNRLLQETGFLIGKLESRPSSPPTKT